MKRILAALTALLLALSLAACGDKPSGNRISIPPPKGAQQSETGGAEKFENQITLSIDKTNYAQEERIEVTLDFSELDQSSAVIVIVKSDAAHGKTAPASDACEEYRSLSDFSEVPFFLWAPDKDGLFDVRVYANTEDGKELASVSFGVGSAVLPTESAPPEDPPVPPQPPTTDPPESSSQPGEESEWFSDEVLKEMGLEGFAQPEGFTLLTDEELPDAFEDNPYYRCLKGASKSEEYDPIVDEAFRILEQNVGFVYGWVYNVNDMANPKYETLNRPIYGDSFYWHFGDVTREIRFTFSTMSEVEGELLQISLKPSVPHPVLGVVGSP